MQTLLSIAGLLACCGSAWLGLLGLRRLVDSVHQQPYEPERRYVVTQPGTNRHREHPKVCQCPQCRAEIARKIREGKERAKAKREGRVAAFQRAEKRA